jgi:putative ABC transport system substrate-binding protein
MTSAPLIAQTSARTPRVGYLFSFKPAEGKHLWEACRQGLRELGYIEGRNIVLEPRWAEGQYDRLRELTAELIRLKVDVIVVAATPGSLAVKAATNTIPVVIVAVADPTRIGLAASLARPGGNITGLSLLTPELSGKRLQLISDLQSGTRTVAVLSNPNNNSHKIFRDETVAAGKQLNIQIDPLQARDPEEIAKAFQEASKRGAQSLIVFDDPVIWSYRKDVVAAANSVRIPTIYGYSEYVSEGGLISYGPHRPDLYRRTASYVDKILKGAKPADLPIERPTRFELYVNAKTAKSLNLVIPQALRLTADEVFE